MTMLAVDPAKLRQLEEDTRRAWVAYRDRLRGLTGERYEAVESASWDQLQVELGRVEERRVALERPTAR